MPRTRGPLFGEHTDPFFAGVGVLDLKKDIHQRDNIITIEMVTTELLLNFWE